MLTPIDLMPMLSRRRFLFGLGVSSVALLVSRPRLLHAFENEAVWHERMRPLMGTFVAIAISHSDRPAALKIISDCFARIEHWIGELSHFREESTVSRLVSPQVLALKECSDAVARMVQGADLVARISGGSFSILSGPLTTLWREAQKSGSMPEKRDIHYALNQIQTSALIPSSAGIEKYGDAALDVGGIGKGLIADMACEYLSARGVSCARVDCGGDLRFLGNGPWRVSIQHPREEGVLREMTLRNGVAVATSGDYRNAWFVNGERMHHLIDQRTGYPSRRISQVTVVAESGIVADALASALFCLEADRASALLGKLCGAVALEVSLDGEQSRFL